MQRQFMASFYDRPPPGVTTYNECSKKVKEAGWVGNDVWYYCSSVRFKN
jgi:hypothetical protein